MCDAYINNFNCTQMPKVVRCIKCNKSFLGTTYTLLEHHKECTSNQPKGTQFTQNHFAHPVRR